MTCAETRVRMKFTMFCNPWGMFFDSTSTPLTTVDMARSLMLIASLSWLGSVWLRREKYCTEMPLRPQKSFHH